MPKPSAPCPTRLLHFHEVCSRTARSRWWVRQQVDLGLFPKPVMINGRRKAWVEAEIESWIGAKIADRDRVA
jgi:prophage regulatory protein